MRTLIIMVVFLISFSWLTDGSDGFSSNTKLKLRRAFFTKRSFLPVYEENSKYNCVILLCLPGLEECTTNRFPRNSYQFIDGVKEDIQDIQCITQFADCAISCMNNWKTF
ncbi:unnamed protein product [Staurois parvus]|uniref:Uncharacterized protein n=1 Tax=Staurois parvus TaxID=386267 RepID=A0ABN9FW80_9NEOB|nr:unnamed protein product [Staurois parvus]